jgi:hypothetical protein
MTGFAAAIPGLGWQVGTASMSALVDRDSHQQRSKYFVDNHVLNQGFEGAVADDEAPRATHAHAQAGSASASAHMLKRVNVYFSRPRSISNRRSFRRMTTLGLHYTVYDNRYNSL